ncbi:hypothetical protein NDU88_005822 [Pleurodeles waltl]|uniref:Uncharacterized protein n=1 Tax=Pleurodeles waltl TaxID=8319 RepID=A0AAV7TVY1_PLEWA|nr:hypothetical protein NDU88_005822 [Pleurodeles waltl]
MDDDDCLTEELCRVAGLELGGFCGGTEHLRRNWESERGVLLRRGQPRGATRTCSPLHTSILAARNHGLYCRPGPLPLVSPVSGAVFAGALIDLTCPRGRSEALISYNTASILIGGARDARQSTNNSGKLVRQLLFSEALLHSEASSSASMTQQPVQHDTTSDTAQESTMDSILQEILAVGQKLERMDNAMASLTAETKSIRLDIAGFQSRVLGLEQRVSLLEPHTTSSRDQDQELLYLPSKVTDLEDRSRRDDVRFL